MNNISDEQFKSEIENKVKLMQQNADRVKQGLEPILESKTSTNPPKEEESTNVTEINLGQGQGKVVEVKEDTYKQAQSKIQGIFAGMQSDRLHEIIKLARQNKILVHFFKDEFEDGELSDENLVLGEQPKSLQETLQSVHLYFHPVRNSRYLEWRDLLDEIASLGRLKAEMSPTLDDDGNTIPAKRTTNNIAETGLTDNEFLHIDSLIRNKETSLYMQMAKWVFHVPLKDYERAESTTFQKALEAAQYRLIYGVVENSKNSIGYLT